MSASANTAFQALCAHVVGGMARSIAARPDRSPAEAEAHVAALVHAIPGFAPRDVAEMRTAAPAQPPSRQSPPGRPAPDQPPPARPVPSLAGADADQRSRPPGGRLAAGVSPPRTAPALSRARGTPRRLTGASDRRDDRRSVRWESEDARPHHPKQGR